MRNPEISRRALLAALFTGALTPLATLSVIGAILNQAVRSNPTREPQPIPAPKLEDPVTTGRLTVHPLVTEHNLSTWQQHGPGIVARLSGYPLIIPEYRPDEYRGSNGNPVTEFADSIYGRSNYVFDQISEETKRRGQEVWVLDPAYNSEFAGLMLAPTTLETLTELCIMYKIGGRIGLCASETEETRWFRDTKKTDLRSTFKDLGKVAAAFFIGLMSDDLLLKFFTKGSLSVTNASLQYETTFRHIVVSELLAILGESLTAPTDALLIYPEAHWKEIKRYLIDKQRRKELLDRFSVLRYLPGGEQLFVGRHYQSDGSNWITLPGIKITP